MLGGTPVVQRKLSTVVAVALVASALGTTYAPSAEAGHAQWPGFVDRFDSYWIGLPLDTIWMGSPWFETPDLDRYTVSWDGTDAIVENAATGGADSLVYVDVDPSYEGSLRVRLNSSGINEMSAGVFLQDGTTYGPAWIDFSAFATLAWSGRVWAYDSAMGYRSLANYTADSWVTVDIDFHATGKYDVCVNGYPVGSDLVYWRAAPSGISRVGLYASGSAGRTVDARWDDVLYSHYGQDFCRATVSAGSQDFWDFTGVGDLYDDAQIRSAAVDAFLDCIDQVNTIYAWLYTGCPYSVLEWEEIILAKLADAAAENAAILPDIVRPTNEAPAAIDQPTPDLDALVGVVVDPIFARDGPAFPEPDCCRPVPEAGPGAPAVPRVPLEPGPSLSMPLPPKVVPIPVDLGAPEMPVEPVVIPLRDHPFEMDWTVSWSPQELVQMIAPNLPPVALAGAQTTSAAEPAPPEGTPEFGVWRAEHKTLVDVLTEATGLPDPTDPSFRVVPLVFEIHTESRGQVKKTPALPLVPALIDVDNNPTTGLLGFDVMVRLSFNVVLNEVSLNVTRLAPWERNMPSLWEQFPEDFPPQFPIKDAVEMFIESGLFPGAPLDLTAYARVPIPMPLPIETVLTDNPDEVLVIAAGFTTQGVDAPFAAQVTVKADSFLPPHPNSRFTIGVDSWEALDNLTLLGGVATSFHTGPPAQDLGTLLDLLPVPPPALPDPAAFWYEVLVDTTAFRLGYRYEANDALLASVSFQPPPDAFLVDVVVETQPDGNLVVRFDGEADTDIRVVVTDERDLLSKPTRDAINVRADKFPQSLVLTQHVDPVLPAMQVAYDADHPLGRLDVVTAERVVFASDGPEWGAPATAFPVEDGSTARAANVLHLGIGDLPASLLFRLDNGTDVFLETDGPIGSIRVVAAEGRAPAVVSASDGLLYEGDDATSRLGLQLRGLRAAKVVTSEEVTTLRWDMLGDRPFRIRLDLDGMQLRAYVSNLPQTLKFATDAASFAELETSDEIRNVDLWMEDAGSGLAARIRVEGIPESLAGRFDLDAGRLRLDASVPIRLIDALVRLGAGAGGLQHVQAHVVDLPGFVAAWDLDASPLTASFEARGDGIGLLVVRGGGAALLDVPAFAATDHAFLLEGNPASPIAFGARLTGLKYGSVAVADETYAFRAEHKRPQEMTVYIDTPDLRVLSVVEPVPATLDVAVDLAEGAMSATYQASEVVDRLAAWVEMGTLRGAMDVRLIPQRIDVDLVDDPAGGLRGDIRTQGRLGSLEAQFEDDALIFGTQWTKAYVRLEGVPEEIVVRVREGGVSFLGGPGSITLVEAAVTNGPQLVLVPGDHVRLVGDAAGDTVEASARIRGLKFVDAEFAGDLRIRIENDRPRPFTGVVQYPHLGVYGVVSVADLPGTIQITSNLVDRHLYEASSVISRIDAYAKYGTLQAWIGLEDVPARLKVLVNSTGEGIEAHLLASSRLHEARVDLFDASGILGTPWQRAYAKVQGLPSVLSVRVTGTGGEFSTEHDMIALLEGAASTTPDLVMLPGDHLAYANITDLRCEKDGRQNETRVCPAQQILTFRIHGLEGARASFGPDEMSARLETRDARPFTVIVADNGQKLFACLYIDPLPQIVDFKSDMRSEHRYDASGVVDKIQLVAELNTTRMHLELRDLPKHFHIQHNATADGGDARIWMDSILRDILLDVEDPAGIGGTEWKRIRAHVADLPRQLDLSWSPTGATFGTGWEQIGLVEFWASTTTGLTELEGDHVRYENVCGQRDQPPPRDGEPRANGVIVLPPPNEIPCQKDVSARLTGLVSARASLTDAEGLAARVEWREPRIFRLLYRDVSGGRAKSAQVTIDQLPAVISFTSDLKSRHIYEASSVVNEITALLTKRDAEDQLTLAARLRNLPARIEVTHALGSDGGSVRIDTTTSISLIEVDASDPTGLADQAFTRFVARVRDLPRTLAGEFTRDAAGNVAASFSTGGESIGLMEAGLTTHPFFLPVPAGNGVLLYSFGEDKFPIEVLSARLHGFTGASFRLDSNGDVATELHLADARPFEAFAFTGDRTAFGRIDPIPEDVTVFASPPGSVVYQASRAIEEVIVYARETTPSGDRILRVDVDTIPASMRFSLNEEEGVAHLDSSEAIGGITVQLRDPEETFGFHNIYAKVVHVPSQLRVSFDDPFQIDLAEGVDTIEVKATALGVYPVYPTPHASIRKTTTLSEEVKHAFSVKVNALKFAEVASRDGFTLAEVRFRESQDLIVHYEETDAFGLASVQYHVDVSNIPKDLKVQLITAGSSGSVVYDASERVGSMRFAMIKSEDDWMDLKLANLPSDLNIDWRFGEDVPWFIRYVSDAPTEVDFQMPTSLGPLGVEALVQNFQWSLLKVPGLIPDVSIDVSVSLIPPDIDINLVLKWTFTLATDTDFLPNHVKITLGLFHSDDFDLAIILRGDLLAQDWLYQASIEVRIGTDTGIDFPIETVGGHAFAELCLDVYVRYDPFGIDNTFTNVKCLGGVYPEP